MLTMMTMVARYMYIFFMLIFVLTGVYIYKKENDFVGVKQMYGLQTVVWSLFNGTSFFLWFLWGREKGITQTLWIGGGLYMAAAILLYAEGRILCRNQSRLIWNCILMLISLGITVLWRMDPEGARRQIYWLYIGSLLVGGIYWLARKEFIWKIPAWLFFLGGAGFIVLPFFFPLASGGSLNWVNIAGIHFQPSELVKICWAFYLAMLYTKDKKTFSLARGIAAYGLMALVLLKQNDLGALLIFGMVLWFMSYMYTGRGLILWGGALAVCIAAVGAYFFVSHVRVRFDAWLDPWKDITDGGYQIAQSLFAVAAGGWFGKGLYQGQSGYIPERSTDMIFAAITEEFGILFSILLIGVYGLLLFTVLKGAEKEKHIPRKNVLMGLGLLLGSQSFLIIAGNIKLLPLTGVTLPFISYGGSSIMCSFIEIAVILAILRQQTGEEKRRGNENKKTNRKKERIREYPFEEPF